MEEIFINNNTFSGYLHSRSMVQLFLLNLQDNMHIFQPLMWSTMALLSWVLTFPMPGSLQFLKPFLRLSLQVLVALALRWHHTLAWACVNNRPIEPWHFLFVLQLSLSSSPIAHYCYSEWKNSFSAWGIQSLEEWQPRPHKSLKRESSQWTYEM